MSSPPIERKKPRPCAEPQHPPSTACYPGEAAPARRPRLSVPRSSPPAPLWTCAWRINNFSLNQGFLPTCSWASPLLSSPAMKHIFLLSAHILATIITLLRLGGVRALVAGNLVLKRQLLIISRSRQRAPNLLPLDRLYLGMSATLLGPRRSLRSAIIIRPSTILGFHRALKKQNISCSIPRKEEASQVPRDLAPISSS